MEERRAALTALTRKYGAGVAGVLTWAEEGAARLLELDGDDERIGELTAERDSLRRELSGMAQALTDARTEAASRFAAAVTAELASLAMPHARVSFDIRQTEDPRGSRSTGVPSPTDRPAPTRSSCCSPRIQGRPPGPSPRARPGVSCLG